jgi:hypothetical protein
VLIPLDVNNRRTARAMHIYTFPERDSPRWPTYQNCSPWNNFLVLRPRNLHHRHKTKHLTVISIFSLIFQRVAKILHGGEYPFFLETIKNYGKKVWYGAQFIPNRYTGSYYRNTLQSAAK